MSMVPSGTGKPEKREGIFQSGNFDKTGKVRNIYSKCLKNKEFNQLKILEANENVCWLFVHKFFLALLHSAYLSPSLIIHF